MIKIIGVACLIFVILFTIGIIFAILTGMEPNFGYITGISCFSLSFAITYLIFKSKE